MQIKINKDNIINVNDVNVIQNFRMNVSEEKKLARLKFLAMLENDTTMPFDFLIKYNKPKVSMKGASITMTGEEMEKNKTIAIEANLTMTGGINTVVTYGGVQKTIKSLADLRDLLVYN